MKSDLADPWSSEALGHFHVELPSSFSCCLCFDCLLHLHVFPQALNRRAKRVRQKKRKKKSVEQYLSFPAMGSFPRTAGFLFTMPTWPEETIKPSAFGRAADWLVLYQSLWESTQTWKENKSPIIIISLIIALLQSTKY